jgi:DNA repair protein SbcD/Mre11
MKLLHTSDWHLGKSLYGVSRHSDHEAVLDEIARYAEDTRPDLVLHTGDIFDGFRPGYEEMHLAVDTLRRLREVAPVVILRGNHDSVPLFKLLHKLLNDDRFVFVDQARLPEHGGILNFPTTRGERIRVAPLPFVHQNRLVETFEDSRSWTGQYTKRIQSIISALGRGLENDLDMSRDILVFAAHLHVSGAVLSGSERKVHVADDYASHVEQLPAVSYAAFGHIHKPQALPTSMATGAFAGSPLQLDFGELGEDKSLVMVEAEPGRPARVERLPLRKGRKLRQFAGTLDELAAYAENIDDALCKLVIRTQEPEPELSKKVADVLPRAVLVHVSEVCAARQIQAVDEQADQSQVEDAGLNDLFRDYLTDRGTDGAPAEGVLELFGAVLGALEAEESPILADEEAFFMNREVNA